MAIALWCASIAHVQPATPIAHGMLKEQLIEGKMEPNVVEIATPFSFARHMDVGCFAQ